MSIKKPINGASLKLNKISTATVDTITIAIFTKVLDIRIVANKCFGCDSK